MSQTVAHDEDSKTLDANDAALDNVMWVEKLPSSKLLAIRRIVSYLGLTLLLMPIQFLLNLTGLPIARKFTRFYHKLCVRAVGVKIIKRGRISQAKPTLFVFNHTSYLDIGIIGSLIEVSFVAKAEIAQWPLIGWLAKMQNSVFVDRKARNTRSHASQIEQRLEQGDNIVLFAEGTTGDGTRLKPMKSSLFSVTQAKPHGQPVVVQPVSMAYARLDSMPMGRSFRPFFAWFGDESLAPHLFNALGLGTLTVVVEFHPAVTAEEFASRKEMAAYFQAEIGDGLAEGLAGRPQVRPLRSFGRFKKL